MAQWCYSGYTLASTIPPKVAQSATEPNGESEETIEANSGWRVRTNESGGRRRITDSRSKARKDEANPRGFATAGSGHSYARTAAEIRADEGRSQRATRREEGERTERLPTTTVSSIVVSSIRTAERLPSKDGPSAGLPLSNRN